MSEENKYAVEVAKENATQTGSSQIVTTASGIRIRLVSVSTALIEEVTSKIEEPEIPMWHNPERDRDEPNPDDPKYQKAIEKANRKRGVAVMDAMAMFGVELVDGMPQDKTWLKKLRFLEKQGRLDLSLFDLEDEFDLEFLYKRYIAVDNETLNTISRISMLTPEVIAKQEENFRRNSKR